MPILISIDGKIFSKEEAKIPVLDRGFLYGDSVYEVLRTYGGKPFATLEHLQRLRKSAEGIFLQIPWSNETLQKELENLLQESQNKESYIRLVVTRGEGSEIGLDPALASSPRRIWVVKPCPSISKHLYENGVNVVFVALSSGVLSGVKTGNYLINILAIQEARKQNAYEAWMINEEGQLSEGASSNIFLVQNETLLTPPPAAGILEGITRRTVITLAKQENIPIEEKNLFEKDALDAKEAFMTSSLREIMPVTKINGNPIGSGTPGNITKTLREAFRKLAGGMAPGI